MTVNRLFEKLPPTWSVPIFLVFLTILVLFRFLTKTALGILCVVIALYIGAWVCNDTKPFDFHELILWLDSLDSGNKTAIASAMLTIIGFLVAFQTATLNWKHQALANLKLETAGEIEAFFSEASRLITNAKIYVRHLVETWDAIIQTGDTENNRFNVRHSLDRKPEFEAIRRKLSTMSVEVHRLLGKNFYLLSGIWGATNSLERANEALGEITGEIWITLPFVNSDHPDALNNFLEHVVRKDCVAFIQLCEKHYLSISRLTGGVHGSLLSPIIDFNLVNYVTLLARRTEFRDLVQEAYDKDKIKRSQ